MKIVTKSSICKHSKERRRSSARYCLATLKSRSRKTSYNCYSTQTRWTCRWGKAQAKTYSNWQDATTCTNSLFSTASAKTEGGKTSLKTSASGEWVGLRSSSRWDLIQSNSPLLSWVFACSDDESPWVSRKIEKKYLMFNAESLHNEDFHEIATSIDRSIEGLKLKGHPSINCSWNKVDWFQHYETRVQTHPMHLASFLGWNL